MPKSDLLLQVAVFSLTAATVALFVIKIYPQKSASIVKHKPKTIQSQSQSPSPTAVLSIKSEKIPPSEITIDVLGINLPVAPGVIADNKWTLYDDKVSWLSTSEPPGFGNVIIYGHNRPGIFAPLANLVIGDEIKVKSGKDTHVYEVAQKRQVLPTDVDVLISDREQLTLYTCDGSYDQKRLIVIAYPKDKT